MPDSFEVKESRPVRLLLQHCDITQYQKAPTFTVSCESSEHHTYRKGAPL
jgi:hypothetical protein